MLLQMQIVDLVLCASMQFIESNSQEVIWLDLMILRVFSNLNDSIFF